MKYKNKNNNYEKNRWFNYQEITRELILENITLETKQKVLKVLLIPGISKKKNKKDFQSLIVYWPLADLIKHVSKYYSDYNNLTYKRRWETNEGYWLMLLENLKSVFSELMKNEQIITILKQSTKNSNIYWLLLNIKNKLWKLIDVESFKKLDNLIKEIWNNDE